MSSPLNYVDESGHYTYAQGKAAHRALQEAFLSIYGAQGEIEYRVTGYSYSPSGVGYVDILLHTASGVEVYEIKPIWQKDVSDEQLPYFSGRMQRQGYIEALQKKMLVNENGNSFNPNMWALPITDTYYNYAIYYTNPEQPGMIYYHLIRSEPSEKYITVIAKEADERSISINCEPQTVLDTIMSISFLGTLLRAGENVLYQLEMRVFPMLVPMELWEPLMYQDGPSVA